MSFFSFSLEFKYYLIIEWERKVVGGERESKRKRRSERGPASSLFAFLRGTMLERH